jgi:hypothetical protein
MLHLLRHSEQCKTRSQQTFQELKEGTSERRNQRACNEQKNKNIRDLYRGINEFKRGYQPRNNLVEDENGDLLADSHNILNRLLNVHYVSDVRQIEVHTAEPLVSGPSRLEVEIAIAKLKKYL